LGCLSQIPDPDFYPSRIQDPVSRISDPTATIQRDEKKFDVIPFYVATNLKKLYINVSFEVLKKKVWVNFPRIIEFFTQKIVIKLSKVWVWDPGSEIRKKPIPDPGSRGQKATGSWIRICNTGYTYTTFRKSTYSSKQPLTTPKVHTICITVS
jgi:hypothetical protein